MGEFKKKQHSLDSNGSGHNTSVKICETDVLSNGSKPVEVNKPAVAPAPPASPTSTTAIPNTATATSDVGKFENISDNGSEISDEGYRSLGLIQQGNNNAQTKRTSLHSQTSVEDVKTEDAKTNGKKILKIMDVHQ